MQTVKEIKVSDNNWFNIAAWVVLAGCLSALMFYGLTFAFSKPTVETITVTPANAVSNNKNNDLIRDVNYQPKIKRKFK